MDIYNELYFTSIYKYSSCMIYNKYKCELLYLECGIFTCMVKNFLILFLILINEENLDEVNRQ